VSRTIRVTGFYGGREEGIKEGIKKAGRKERQEDIEKENQRSGM
jgi:hypothetical protein